MIVDFSVQNYRSIKDMQVLAMNAANIVSKNKELDEANIIPVSPKLSLLKSKAIYGANASGKSNMLRALASFLYIVNNSVKDDESLSTNIKPFGLSTETHKKPSYFQLSFILNGVPYRYGFEATVHKIESEWLFGTPGKKEVFFFIRTANDIKVNEQQFKEGSKVVDLYTQSDNDIARNDSLFLTAVRSFSHGLAKEIIEYFNRYIFIYGIGDENMHKRAEISLESGSMRSKISKLLQLADIGISDVMRLDLDPNESDPSKKRYFTVAEHAVHNPTNEIDTVLFSLSYDESDGTQKLFALSPHLFQSLEDGRVIVIDEFDARLHPLLGRKILELYNSLSNQKAQLIFATHDTNLLAANMLRRDQICFAEKDKNGASHYYSLADFKGVRNDASYEKDYIAGKYGAIPFLGDFRSLFED